MKSIVEQSHDFLLPCLHKGAICIDATLGNGKDALFFLKNKVKKVYGFEVQEDILKITLVKIGDDRLVGIFDGHEKMQDYVKEEVDAIIFNFGYCPNSESDITTLPDTSLLAVKHALNILKHKGRMVLVMYPHNQGRKEAELIENHLKQVDHHLFYIEKSYQLNQDNSPYLLKIEKIR